MKRFLFTMAMMSVLTLSAQTLGFPILSGELSNSAATSVEDIDEVMPRMRALGLNTVLVPAYWEFVEPVEGKFDFTLIDRTIDVARRDATGAAARSVPLVRRMEEFDVMLCTWVVQEGHEAFPTSDDCRRKADGDCIVFQ